MKKARLSEEESLERGFELRQSGKISQTGRQRIPGITDYGATTGSEGALTKRFQITFRNYQKLFV